MTNVPFTCEDFEQTHTLLIQDVIALMTTTDKSFLVSFELESPTGITSTSAISRVTPPSNGNYRI